MQEHFMRNAHNILSFESSSVRIWGRNVYAFHLQETANGG